jgi:hypothetical protein
MINKFICLIFGHNWRGWRRGLCITRKCTRCGKFEFQTLDGGK